MTRLPPTRPSTGSPAAPGLTAARRFFDSKVTKKRMGCNESRLRSHSFFERRGSMKELLAELFDRYHQDVYTYLYSRAMTPLSRRI